MRLLSRVVWSEGMYLAPHHFQTQNRYFEDAIHFAASALWFQPWGFSGYEMDGEALLNGTVSLTHGRGVFPDGLVFNIPDSDSGPQPRAIRQSFHPTRDSHVILLAIPRRRTEGRNFSTPSDGVRADARYTPETRVLPDEMNGRDEKAVELGRKNFRLILDVEAGEDVVTLPVGRVLRDGSGHFVYDRSFVPPLLDIAASEYLMGLLRRLCDLLDEKGRAITAERDPAASIADHYRRDLPSFWFLHTVFTSLGPLRHILLAKRSHPEHLYKEMLRLAGGLCCFALNAHPKDLPLYNHEDLRSCFETLDERIRGWLELVVRTNGVVLDLKSLAPYYWNTPVHDTRLFDHSRWLLEVRCNVGEAAVISRTPRLVKVCSKRFVTELVRRAVPGLTLTHLPSPPPEIATKVDAQYFSISKAGPCWEDIVHTQHFGIYVPGDLPDPQLALHVIVER